MVRRRSGNAIVADSASALIRLRFPFRFRARIAAPDQVTSEAGADAIPEGYAPLSSASYSASGGGSGRAARPLRVEVAAD
jgi:hypothetical protein